MHQQILDSLDENTRKNVLSWLEGPYDEVTKKEIKNKLVSDLKEIHSSFFENLTFGTAGIRGIMGIGTNRINQYTIRKATQGLANYLLSQNIEKPSVIIGHDNRNNSSYFAKEAAKVLAANGIQVYIFAELRPTPLVSFGCRYKHCSAAIMITASHNPPEYNGFKVYWSDGALVLPPHDKGIMDQVNRIKDPDSVLIAKGDDPKIEWIQNAIDTAYVEAVRPLQHYKENNTEKGSQLKVIYSNLHGAGITLIPMALEDWGFTNIEFVEEQKPTDGNFPFAPNPNPDDEETLLPGMKKLIDEKADIFIATDPDADRMALVVHHDNKPVILTGNQIACILLKHICEALVAKNTLPNNAAFVKSIVTTDLFEHIVESYQKTCFNVLTGFKYITEKIRQWEKGEGDYQFIFGAEESNGFLAGTLVRDKDAINASLLICEAALKAKLEKKTLVDVLYDIYKQYGVYREKTISINLPLGEEGNKRKEHIMHTLRHKPFTSLGHLTVMQIDDYALKTSKDLLTNKTHPITLPTSDVLSFIFEDGSKIIIRPSGTEPKIKIYGSVIETNTEKLPVAIEISDERLDTLLNTFSKHLDLL